MVQTQAKTDQMDPSQVKDSMGQTMKASTLLQLYTNTILQTPDINLPQQVDKDSNSSVSTDLPKHQATARDNANYFINTINPLMLKTLADIIAFSNNWKAFYNHLVTLAHAIDEGNNKEEFSKGLSILQGIVQSKSDSTVPVITELNQFLPKLQQDQRNFTQDHNNVVVALGGESGEIAQLKAEIDSINSAISKDNAMIAGGAVGEVVGVLMITVGVLAEFETAGASTALIVGGLAVMGGSSAIIGIAANDLSNKQDKLKQDTQELTILQQLYSTVNVSDSTIQNLVSALNDAVAAIESLQKGWNSLHDDFEEVIQSLESADPSLGAWLVDQLDAANKNWEVTRDLAMHLQANGTIPVKKEDKTGDTTKIAL